MSDYLYLPDLEKELDSLRDLFEDDEYTLDEEELDRLKALRDLADELGGTLIPAGDETLIPEEDFEDYAQEFAGDIGAIDSDSSMYFYVDWERYASDLAMDFTSVTFDGHDYYIRLD